MATRSTISIEENGKIRSIYCHWDGYPTNNGAILLEHYNTSDKVNELINLGSLSFLAENIRPIDNGTITSYVSYTIGYETKSATEPHSFDNPHDNVVIAYHRDRGEELVIDEYFNKKDIKGEEYDYLFVNGEWKVRFGKNFVRLTKEMCELV
jgi:hypothetical protein